MRLIYSFISVVIILTSSCKTDKENNTCTRFRTGNFYYKMKPEGYRVVVNRRDSVQTEHNKHTDMISGYNIKWISACEYEMTILYKGKKGSTTPRRFENTLPLRTKLVDSGEDYYIFESYRDSVYFKFTDTMWVLK